MDLASILVGATSGGLVGFLVAHLTVRTTVGVLAEQAAVAELEVWADDAANLAADLGRSWATAGRSMDDREKTRAEDGERRLRVALARVRRHLPQSFESALASADDLVNFNRAAIGARYLKALSDADYSTAPPIPATPGSTGWKPLGAWIDEQHEGIASACAGYRSRGRGWLR